MRLLGLVIQLAAGSVPDKGHANAVEVPGGWGWYTNGWMSISQHFPSVPIGLLIDRGVALIEPPGGKY